ncbi:MAG: hypothetical protein R3304_07245 [Longimicrobiales bacterium]|nr:hypothetical protein [Longimicrobiales bacterium]
MQGTVQVMAFRLFDISLARAEQARMDDVPRDKSSAGGPGRPTREGRARTRAAAGLALTMLALGPLPVTAQQDPDPVRVWLAAGLGAGGSAEVESGLAFTAQLTGQWRRHHAALRTLSLVDFAGFPDSSTDDAVSELSAMYGRWSPTGFGHAAWSVGLGVVSVDGLESEASGASRSTAGLSLGAEASLQSLVLGVAIQGFANLNPLASYVGVTGMLLLGWMP